MSKKIKRFIAGAICPKCSALDTLQIYQDGEHDVRECVDCGFKDVLRFKQNASELDTRVNKTAEQIASETQVIKFPRESGK